jgi:hypothetical protein
VRGHGLLLAAAVVVVLGVLAALVVRSGGGEEAADTGAGPSTSVRRTTTTASSTTTSTSSTTAPPVPPPPETTTVPPPATAAAPPTTAGPPRGHPYTFDPYRGLGAWVDVFDWTVGYDRTPDDPPSVGLDDIDRMADLGVRTLYFQPARWDAPFPGVLEPEQAAAIVDRAHARGMAVVGWYLPTLTDPVADRAQIEAVLALPIDGFGLDIESTAVPDEAERNARVVQLATDVRAAHPGEVLSAIVLPPVVTEVYGTYWGGFPWEQLAPLFDVWQPMGYWTMRAHDSEWRDPYLYTATNIDLIRQATGRPDAVVHPVGGVADGEGARPNVPVSPDDVFAMVQAAAERGSPGASLYDYVTTGDELWPALQSANNL